MSRPNTHDVDDNKPMLKDENEHKKSGGLGGIFRKKPGSPRKRQSNGHSIEVKAQSQTTAVNKKQKNKNSKTDNGNIFGRIGKIFKSSKPSDLNSDINRQINTRLKEEESAKTRCLNMLLLGAGGSGKTTVFKQMDKLYNGNIDEKQLELAKEDIFRNILTDIYDLSKYNIKLNSAATDERYRLSNDELINICHRISTWHSHFILEDPSKKLTWNLAVELDKLWKDKAMKHTWDKRRNSHIMDNTPYFMDKILEIVTGPDTGDHSYFPTFDDFVRVRNRTTGIIVKDFLAQTEFGQYRFSVTDVGGQRAERRKWMRLFDNISVVVYIMSLSAYDQHLYEDNTKNCWDETLELFSKTSHESVFDGTDWVIFFNKVDIFETKILKVPFTVYQPNFNELHAHNSQKVKEYITDQFTFKFYDGLTKERKKKRGSIYFHITCATKQESVGKIIQKVQIDLIKSQMKKMGYLM